MKVFSRDFTRKEKALLIFLSLLMIGLAYYRFVDMDVRETIEKSNAEADNLRIELQTLQARVTLLRNLQAQLDAMEEEDALSYMPSYNSVKEEVAFLNDVLASAEKYSISFADVTRSGAQIRRSFTLQYTTLTYSAAEEIIRELCGYKNRCLVSDIYFSNNEKSEITMNAAATFYETMIGGTADAGLPDDSAVVNS